MKENTNLHICLRYLLGNLPTSITFSKDIPISLVFVKSGIPPKYRLPILYYLKDTGRYLQSGNTRSTSYRFIPDKDLDDIVEELIENIKFPIKCNWVIQKEKEKIIGVKEIEEKQIEDKKRKLLPVDIPLDIMIGQRIFCIYGHEMVSGVLIGINGYYHPNLVTKEKKEGRIKVPMFRILYQVLIIDDSLEDKLVTLHLEKEQIDLTPEGLIKKITKNLEK